MRRLLHESGEFLSWLEDYLHQLFKIECKCIIEKQFVGDSKRFIVVSAMHRLFGGYLLLWPFKSISVSLTLFRHIGNWNYLIEFPQCTFHHMNDDEDRLMLNIFYTSSDVQWQCKKGELLEMSDVFKLCVQKNVKNLNIIQTILCKSLKQKLLEKGSNPSYKIFA